MTESAKTADWFCLDSGPGDYAFNMALDEALLESMPDLARPVLRFYGWTTPAASFGYFQKYCDVERMTSLRPLVRRPTGGGLVPHADDWTYSLTFPTGHEWYALTARQSYQRVHTWLQAGFDRIGVATVVAASSQRAGPGECFVGHEQSDLLWHGKKIAGAAQRRTRIGLLIQGSVQPPPIHLNRNTWQQAMLDVLANHGHYCSDFAPSAQIVQKARSLAAEKYSQDKHNRRVVVARTGIEPVFQP